MDDLVILNSSWIPSWSWTCHKMSTWQEWLYRTLLHTRHGNWKRSVFKINYLPTSLKVSVSIAMFSKRHTPQNQYSINKKKWHVTIQTSFQTQPFPSIPIRIDSVVLGVCFHVGIRQVVVIDIIATWTYKYHARGETCQELWYFVIGLGDWQNWSLWSPQWILDYVNHFKTYMTAWVLTFFNCYNDFVGLNISFNVQSVLIEICDSLDVHVRCWGTILKNIQLNKSIQIDIPTHGYSLIARWAKTVIIEIPWQVKGFQGGKGLYRNPSYRLRV